MLSVTKTGRAAFGVADEPWSSGRQFEMEATLFLEFGRAASGANGREKAAEPLTERHHDPPVGTRSVRMACMMDVVRFHPAR